MKKSWYEIDFHSDQTIISDPQPPTPDHPPQANGTPPGLLLRRRREGLDQIREHAGVVLPVRSSGRRHSEKFPPNVCQMFGNIFRVFSCTAVASAWRLLNS